MPDHHKDQFIDIKTHDHKILKLTCWQASENPECIVHILHGMAEHKLRYKEFARFLNNHAVCVYAHDHRGHGDSAELGGTIGHFGDKNGFKNVLADVESVQQFIRKTHPDTPLFILAHSMGSFIAQNYLLHYQPKIHGLILTGSALSPGFLVHSLRAVATLEKLRVGARKPSTLLNNLTFGSYNKTFKPTRTVFDWLSRDNQTVNQYMLDPLCGFMCSTESWQQLASALLEISDASNFSKVDKNLPLLLISGDKDPVGGFGKTVKALYQFWKELGQTQVTLELLTDARHEVLNEINKEKTYNDILQWIFQQSRHA